MCEGAAAKHPRTTSSVAVAGVVAGEDDAVTHGGTTGRSDGYRGSEGRGGRGGWGRGGHRHQGWAPVRWNHATCTGHMGCNDVSPANTCTDDNKDTQVRSSVPVVVMRDTEADRPEL
jgi:hypothetical protein